MKSHIKQLIVDNNYSNKQIDQHAKNFINMKMKSDDNMHNKGKTLSKYTIKITGTPTIK